MKNANSLISAEKRVDEGRPGSAGATHKCYVFVTSSQVERKIEIHEQSVGAARVPYLDLMFFLKPAGNAISGDDFRRERDGGEENGDTMFICLLPTGLVVGRSQEAS